MRNEIPFADISIYRQNFPVTAPCCFLLFVSVFLLLIWTQFAHVERTIIFVLLFFAAKRET